MGLKEKIIQQFEKNAWLKVLFFFDPENENLEEVDALLFNDIKVVKYANDPFNLKVKFKNEWASEKIFLYFSTPAPSSEEEYKKFPLLDVLVANKELRLGDVSDFMEQYHLPLTKHSLVSQYMRELKSNKVQEVLMPILNPHSFSEETVQRGLISAFMKFTEPQSWNVLLTRLFILSNTSNIAELNRVEKKLRETNLDSVVMSRLSDLLDESVTQLTQDSLSHLLARIKYNLIVYNIPLEKHDPYAPLKITHSSTLAKLGILFEQARIHSRQGDEFVATLLLHGKNIKEETILRFYGRDAAYFWLPTDLKWLIIADRMKEIYDSPAKAFPGIEAMSLQYEENKDIQHLLNVCLYTVNCFLLIDGIPGYRLNTPEEYIAKYTGEYYKIDTFYRKAITRLGYIDQTEVPAFVLLDKLRSELNTRYEEWLEKINREWLSCLNVKQFDYSKLSVPKQYTFYANKLVSLRDQKVVVLISDALRYEVGVELLHEMHNDSKNEAVVSSMLASIPSKTSVGMSNLLPGTKRMFNNDEITIDALPAKSLVNRQTILQAISKNAVTVSFEQVRQNSQSENRELFKAPLVYIYHNHIDATGDNPKSENRTFNDVELAIDGIKKLVKLIHSTYNVARILITADHGFIYNDRPIAETDKEDPPGGEPVIQHNRFAVYNTPFKPAFGYCIPLKSTTKFEDEKWVVFPASTNRYKRQGSGKQYVHGGASLQELLVPVIESARRRREDVIRKVTVRLLTPEPKIVSNILKVEILQESNVSRYEKGRTVKLGIYKEGDLVSTEQEVVLDSTSEMASERLFTCTIKLTKPDLGQSGLLLKIFDVELGLNTLIEKPVINNTLIQTDF